MAWIKTYLLQLTAAALIAGVVTNLLNKNTGVGKVVHFVCGIFLMLVLVMPWTRVKIQDFSDYLNGISVEANAAVDTGKNMAYDELAQIIKSKTEAYILDKADSFGAELSVEVKVAGSELPVPISVKISGSISPYGKTKLKEIIAQDVGIALEEQKWTG